MRRYDEDLRRSMPSNRTRRSPDYAAQSAEWSSSGRALPATVSTSSVAWTSDAPMDPSKITGHMAESPNRLSQTQYSHLTNTTTKYGGGSVRSPMRDSDSVLGAQQPASQHQVSEGTIPQGQTLPYNTTRHTYSGAGRAAESYFDQQNALPVTVPVLKSSYTGSDHSSSETYQPGRGESGIQRGYIHERTTASVRDASEKRSQSLPIDSSSKLPSSPGGRPKLAELPKSMSLAAPSLAAMIRDQVHHREIDSSLGLGYCCVEHASHVRVAACDKGRAHGLKGYRRCQGGGKGCVHGPQANRCQQHPYPSSVH